MRLNRGTIVLLVVSVIVIIGVLIFNNNQANAPAEATPTSQQTGGPIFPGVTSSNVTRFEVRDNTTGARSVLVQSDEGVWTLDTTEEATETPPAEDQLDQTAITTNVDAFLALNSADSFESDQLADFGLDQPQYSILATSDDGAVYVLHIGNENPSGNRYYAIQEQLSTADVNATEEPQAVATQIVESGDNILGDVLTEEATAEVTPEATTDAAVTAEADESTPATDATEEATAEVTPEATTDAAVTTEPLPTATLAPLAEPLVILSGTHTILVVPKGTIDTLIAYITTPPIVIPTPTPFGIPELTQETTAEVTPEPTPDSTESAEEDESTPASDATEEATAEATPAS
jgi:hypothetical protein